MAWRVRNYPDAAFICDHFARWERTFPGRFVVSSRVVGILSAKVVGVVMLLLEVRQLIRGVVGDYWSWLAMLSVVVWVATGRLVDWYVFLLGLAVRPVVSVFFRQPCGLIVGGAVRLPVEVRAVRYPSFHRLVTSYRSLGVIVFVNEEVLTCTPTLVSRDERYDYFSRPRVDISG